jgi:hypothetical protein
VPGSEAGIGGKCPEALSTFEYSSGPISQHDDRMYIQNAIEIKPWFSGTQTVFHASGWV